MKTAGTRLWRSLLLTALMLAAFSVASYSSPGKKKPKAYRDINAIGRRVIGYQHGHGNWYSLDMEKQIGAQISAEYETSTPIFQDGATQTYLDRLAQAISQNSDTQFPITTRVVNSEDSFAVTLPGGYQYISRGLLLRMENEGELAAVIARGIAHTSLRSATGLATRASLTKMMTIPLIFIGSNVPTGNTTTDAAVPLMLLKYRRDDESAADYFGVQYLYKSGYSPECFISFVQKAWPTKTQPISKTFSSFLPLPERLETLRKEIQEILPTQGKAVTNTESFANFREHLLTLPPPPKTLPAKPPLVRPDPPKPN